MWQLIMLELMKDLPILLISFILYFFAVKYLTPNPKRGVALRWLCAEIIEHALLPGIFILFLLLPIPLPGVLIYAAVPIIIFYLYGRVLGKIKVKRDVLKLTMLCLSILFILLMPSMLEIYLYGGL